MIRWPHVRGSLPPDNPFLGAGTARCNAGPAAAGPICQETYLWGLRNPFRFAFQPATGRLHVNDVGQGAWDNAILGLFGTPAGNVMVASRFAAGAADLVIDRGVAVDQAIPHSYDLEPGIAWRTPMEIALPERLMMFEETPA